MSTPTGGDPSPAPTSQNESQQAFDIVATYNRLLASDPDLTMPVAAIESLVEALGASTASTISETLSLLKTNTDALKSATPNPISLSAGTDLFQRYLITTLNRSTDSAGDFKAVRNHLLSNGRLFVQRAKESREKIASFGQHFVRDGATVLTNGGSRVVGALLRSAADGGAGGRSSIRFRVIYVVSNKESGNDTPSQQQSSEGTAKDKVVGGKSRDGEGSLIVSMLRSKGVPVATIPESAVAYSMGKVSMVLVGAEGVVENGGIISRLGTYQMGVLAKAAGKPLYVVAESHKFVRLYPLSQYDLPIAQRVIEFKVGEPGKEVEVGTETGNVTTSLASRTGNDETDATVRQQQQQQQQEEDEGIDVAPAVGALYNEPTARMKKADHNIGDAVDFTPPDLISGIITESGVLTPSAVSEELIKIWF